MIIADILVIFVIYLYFDINFDDFIGTKWCGAGDIAENYHDLGQEVQIDRSIYVISIYVKIDVKLLENYV